jgi:hypothetical protein
MFTRLSCRTKARCPRRPGMRGRERERAATFDGIRARRGRDFRPRPEELVVDGADAIGDDLASREVGNRDDVGIVKGVHLVERNGIVQAGVTDATERARFGFRRAHSGKTKVAKIREDRIRESVRDPKANCA